MALETCWFALVKRSRKLSGEYLSAKLPAFSVPKNFSSVSSRWVAVTGFVVRILGQRALELSYELRFAMADIGS